ncbi:MAG: hypothetical protein QOJ00_1716 [Actinomycetota bacterium]
MLDIPKRDRRSERREATRAEIVEAAWELCRADGLAALSLRDVARRVGMQAPSLYSYFASKNDIYDAMFAQGVQEFVAAEPDVSATRCLREALRLLAHYFVTFCTEDPARYQLLFQRTIPGFEPSPESFATSVDSLQRFAAFFEAHGLRRAGALDMYTALTTGLVDQQISNDPGGDRWLRLLDDAVDMFLAYATQPPPKNPPPKNPPPKKRTRK